MLNLTEQLNSQDNFIPQAGSTRIFGGQNQTFGTDGNWHVNSESTATPKTTVSMIDTGSAVTQINKQKGYLDTTYPSVTPLPSSTQSPSGGNNSSENAPTAASGKAYFTNQAGQDAEYTQAQLNDPNTQKFLKDNGYILVKSDGVSVGSDFSTSNLKSGVDSANAQIESMTHDILNYVPENDPQFQAQSAQIRADFEKLKMEMARTNTSREQSLSTLNMRGGTTQYADGIGTGIVGEEIKQGGERLAEIARQEAAAISAARAAFKTGKWTEFNNQINLIKDVRDQKAKQLSDYNTSIINYTKNLQEQQKFNFEVYKYQQEQKAGNKMMVVSPGSSIYDPNTGDFLGTAPEKPADNKPITEKVGDKLIQWNPTTGVWDTVFSGADLGVTANALDWAQQITSGNAKLSEVPTELRSQVVTAMKQIPPDTTKVQALQEKLKNIDELLSSPGMNSVVGPNVYARLHLNPFNEGNRQDFIAGVQQLISQDTLNTLINLKQQGGTLGALSDTERVMLQSAASKIGTWTMKDANGNITGYKITEDLFKKELGKIKDLTQKAIDRAGGVPVVNTQKKLDDYYLANPEKRAYIDSLDMKKNPSTGRPYTDEEKLQILNIPFNNELQTSQNGKPTSMNDAQKIAAAIKQVESGGNYKAKGGSGEFGAYQFMPSSWKGWAKQYLGDSSAPMTPENQDKVAMAKIQDLLNKGYSAREVALIWNGGQPVIKKGTNKYGVKYDSGAYSNKVINALNKLS